MTNEEIKRLETELWGAADNLRANSKLTVAEYKDPVLGLILLRYAQNKFEEAKKQIEKDLAEFVQLQKLALSGAEGESENSWTVNIAALDQNTLDLSAKNPNTPEEAPLRKPSEILKNMADLDKESASILENIKGLI